MNNDLPTTSLEKPLAVPGRNAFCEDCRYLQDARCHWLPPSVNNQWLTGRGSIFDPKKEWCGQFKPRQ